MQNRKIQHSSGNPLIPPEEHLEKQRLELRQSSPDSSLHRWRGQRKREFRFSASILLSFALFFHADSVCGIFGSHPPIGIGDFPTKPLLRFPLLLGFASGFFAAFGILSGTAEGGEIVADRLQTGQIALKKLIVFRIDPVQDLAAFALKKIL